MTSKLYRFSSTVGGVKKYAGRREQRVSYVIADDATPPRNYKDGNCVFQSTSLTRTDSQGREVVTGESTFLDLHNLQQSKCQDVPQSLAEMI